jgi:hypothetical protein
MDRSQLFLSTYAFSQKNEFDSRSVRGSTDKQCLSLIKKHSSYWIADSSGKSGFRRLLGEKFLKSCSFKNVRWSDLKVYLGWPSLQQKGIDIIVYYYRLNDSLDIKDVGSVILIIWVKNDGLVEDFIVQEIDG